MPEIKNAFLKGKMNKDLDERLVPNGEYRDALNIDVDYSDGSDVGALKNIKGNAIIDSINLNCHHCFASRELLWSSQWYQQSSRCNYQS